MADKHKWNGIVGKPTGTIRAAYDLNNDPYLFEATGAETKRFIDLLNADDAGRLLALDDRTALAIAAGARAIRENKRLVGTKYVYDVFGKNGGPYEISYHEASEILAAIWDAYPLPEPPGGDA